MPELPAIFTESVEFDPAADLDLFLRQVPGKWVVYLLCDSEDRPIQLLCVKNLRASLKRRLGGNETIGLSKRVNYREVVRRVRWRRVDSAFEADLLYYEAARTVFPDTYQGMVGFRPAWFVHVNPENSFPRYVKTVDLSKGGVLAGPIEDKHAAARLIELIEDAFDLCRYYHILIEAPHGRACAYKQMHKCPAPCDGSISMEHYRLMMDWSVRTLVDPQPFIREHRLRMQQAAAELRFETAGKIKGLVDQISQLGKGPFRHLRRLADFQFLVLQHGPRDGTAKAFLVTPGGIEEILGIVNELPRPADVLRHALLLASEQVSDRVDAEGAERVGIVAHHLFSARSRHGAFIPLELADEKALLKAYRDLKKQVVEDDAEEEGVLKELQSMGQQSESVK